MRSYTAIYLVTFGIVATFITESMCGSRVWGRAEAGDFQLFYEHVQGKLANGNRIVNYKGPTADANRVRITQVILCDKLPNSDIKFGLVSGGPAQSSFSLRISSREIVDFEVFAFGSQNGVKNPPLPPNSPFQCKNLSRA